MTAGAALTATGIGVSFSGVQVLRNVSLDILPGEIHRLIGENGAGKSTLGKVLGGYYPASTGTLDVFSAVWIMTIFALVLTFLLNRTAFGRRVFAVGGNEEAAILSGIRTDRVKTATFAIAGFVAGLASIIATSPVALGQASAGEGMELQAIAAVILGGASIYGGAGAVWRSLGGVFLLALISNGVNILNADPFYRDLATGLVILAAIGVSVSGRPR